MTCSFDFLDKMDGDYVLLSIENWHMIPHGFKNDRFQIRSKKDPKEWITAPPFSRNIFYLNNYEIRLRLDLTLALFWRLLFKLSKPKVISLRFCQIESQTIMYIFGVRGQTIGQFTHPSLYKVYNALAIANLPLGFIVMAPELIGKEEPIHE